VSGPETLEVGLEIGPFMIVEPIALAVGAAVIAGVGMALLWEGVYRRRILGRPEEGSLLRAMIATASPVRRRAKAVMLLLGIAGIAIALAKPYVRSRGLVEQRGLDLVVAVDVSKSMMVNDVPKARLEQARRMAAALLDKMRGDRAAVIAFAGAAVHFPLTVDHDASLTFLSDFGPNDLPHGSDLAEALRSGRCLLRPDLYDQLGCPAITGRRGTGGDPLPGERDLEDEWRRRSRGEPERDLWADPTSPEPEEEVKEERGKVIVLFTDGGDETGKAAEEASIARQLGIAVVVVGFGTTQGGEVWDVDDEGNRTSQKRDASGAPVISRRADDGMKAIAAAAGAEDRYIIAPPTGEADPRAIMEAMAGVQRGLTAKTVKQAAAVYHWFLFPALMLLVVEALLATRRRTAVLVAPRVRTKKEALR
jgi:Ca-activated chloride channel family protein